MDAAGDHAGDCVAGVASPSTPQAPKVAAGMRMSVCSAFQIESKPSTLCIRNSPTVMPRRESDLAALEHEQITWLVQSTIAKEQAYDRDGCVHPNAAGPDEPSGKRELRGDCMVASATQIRRAPTDAVS